MCGCRAVGFPADIEGFPADIEGFLADIEGYRRTKEANTNGSASQSRQVTRQVCVIFRVQAEPIGKIMADDLISRKQNIVAI